MQTVWSRAVQTRCTCKCASCISYTTAVTGRAGAATVRRFLRPSSTLLYSTIFATAAVADGRTKRKRREQWDTAIISAKQDLQLVKEENGREEAEKSGEEMDFTSTLTRELSEAAGTDVSCDGTEGLDYGLDDIGTPSDNVDADEIEELWDYIKYDCRLPGAGRPEWPLNLGPTLQPWNLPPQSLWSSDIARARHRAIQYSKKKCMTVEKSVAKLIHVLMYRSGIYGLSETALEDIPMPLHAIAILSKEKLAMATRAAIQVLENIDSMSEKEFRDREKSGRLTESPLVLSPQYLRGEVLDPRATCDQLNYAFKSLFTENSAFGNLNDPKVLVADVCHNLLISPVPLDLQSYNILIAGFAKLKMPRQCEAVITSLLETHMRVNEVTCAHILRFYTDLNRPDIFTKFVGLMRGKDRGLMVARRDIRITDAGRHRLVRKPDGKVIQKVYPTPMVFHTLMSGVLKFTGIDRAVEIYDLMKEDLWGMDYKGLVQFLEAAAEARDWANGNFIWEEIKALREKTNGKVWISVWAWALFMDLCRTTDHYDAFAMIRKEAVDAGIQRVHLQDALTMLLERRLMPQTSNNFHMELPRDEFGAPTRVDNVEDEAFDELVDEVYTYMKTEEVECVHEEAKIPSDVQSALEPSPVSPPVASAEDFLTSMKLFPKKR